MLGLLPRAPHSAPTVRGDWALCPLNQQGTTILGAGQYALETIICLLPETMIGILLKLKAVPASIMNGLVKVRDSIENTLGDLAHVRAESEDSDRPVVRCCHTTLLHKKSNISGNIISLAMSVKGG